MFDQIGVAAATGLLVSPNAQTTLKVIAFAQDEESENEVTRAWVVHGGGSAAVRGVLGSAGIRK